MQVRVWQVYKRKKLKEDGTVTFEKAAIPKGVYWTYFQRDGGYMTMNKFDGEKWGHRDDEVVFYRKMVKGANL